MDAAKEIIVKNNILKGADELFQKNGINKITMEDIAKKVGKGKSTLYYYFKSKEEIFEAIIHSEKERFFTVIQEAVAKETTATGKIRVFQKMRFDMIREKANLYAILIAETREAMEADNKCYWRKIYDEKEMNIFRCILEFGSCTGEFRKISNPELDAISFLFTSALRGMEMDLIMYNKLGKSDDILNVLLDLVIFGLKK
jgi:AcrR family transcriptional regulator